MPADNIGIKFTTIGGQAALATSTNIAKAMEGINVKQMQLVRSQTTAAGITRTYQTTQQRLVTSTQAAGKEQEKYTKVVKDTTLAKKGLLGQTQSLLAAIGKVAIWMIATTAVFAIMRAVQKLVSTLMEFENAMARVSTATRGNEEALLRVRNAVKEYGRTTSASLMEVAKAMYLLGSAGLTANEQVAGLEHVMDLTVGTMGQVDQVARLVSGAYNVFGQNLEGAITASEKMQQISDIMAYTFSTQQIELSEIASAMGLVGSVAGLIEMPLNVLVGTLGELNTSLLKGTRAGTCYDDKTEVLTKDGFKFWKDVTMDDVFATLNPKTHQLEYHKPNKIIREHYEGKMYHAKNRFLNLCVTPNHWMYTRHGDVYEKYPYKIKQAKDIFGKRETYTRGAKWKGNDPEYFVLPSIMSNHGKNKEHTRKEEILIPIKTYLRFLGFYLSEGNVSRYTDGKGCSYYRILIAQTKKDISKFKKIEACLKKMPFNFKYRHYQFAAQRQQLYEYLKKFGKSNDKYVPQFVKDLSPKLLRIFLEAYKVGDGDKKGRIVTASIKMRDDLEEVALKAGYGVQHHILRKKGEISRPTWSKKTKKNVFCPTSDIWQINICKTVEFSFNQKRNVKLAEKKNYISKTKEEWIDYKGMIYCCNVPNHIVFVRRQGRTVWSVNSIMNALLQISKKSDMLTDKLGVVFDPTKPLDFVDVMEKLNRKYGEGALSVMELKELMDVFGLRGGRAVGIILNRYERWLKTVNKGKQDFEGFAELMREKFEDTLPRQLAIVGNSIQVAFIDMFEEAGSGLTRFLVKINKATKTRRQEVAETKRSMEALSRLEKVSLGVPRISPRLKELEYTKEGYEAVLKGLGLQDNLIGKLAMRKDIGALILTDQEDMLGNTKDEDQAARDLTEALKKGADTQGDMNQKIEAARPLLEKLFGISEARAFISSKMAENGIRNLENAKEEIAVTKDLLYSTERGLVAEEKRHQIQMMRMDGYSDEEIAHQTLVNFVEEINAAKRKDLGTTENIVTLNQLLVATDKERLVLMAQLGGNLEKNVLKFSKLVNQEFEAAEKFTASIADNLERAVEGGIEKLLTGTGNWKDVLNDISNVMLKAQITEAVKSMGMTGIFKTVASGITQAHRTGGDYVKQKAKEGHIEGMAEASGAAPTVSSTGAAMPPAGGGGGIGGLVAGVIGGLFGGRDKYGIERGGPVNPLGQPGMRRPGRPGMGYGTAVDYSSASSGMLAGGMAGGGMAGAGGGGIGSAVGGVIGGAIGSFGGPVGVMIGGLIGSMVGGLFDQGGEEEQIDRKEEQRTTRIASKLEIANKQLEWVNRNLVALRTEQEPYPMPESAYFAERWGGRGGSGGATFGNIIIQVGSDAQGTDVADAFAERFIVNGNRILQ